MSRYSTDGPDATEIAELNAEQEARLNRQVRAERERLAALTPEERAAEWDRANEENIARGWGPLPF